MPLSPFTPLEIRLAYVGIAPSATYLSTRSGRIPSDANKTTLLANAALAGAFSGAAMAPAGSTNKERISRTENKRSRGIRRDALLRRTMNELCISSLSSGKLDLSVNCKHGQMRSCCSPLHQIGFAHHTAFHSNSKGYRL